MLSRGHLQAPYDVPDALCHHTLIVTPLITNVIFDNNWFVANLVQSTDYINDYINMKVSINKKFFSRKS